jgi:hypothetical protein
MEFSVPATHSTPITDDIKKNDLVGALIAFQLTSYDAELATEFGQTTAAFGALTVIDGPHAGKTVEEWAIFGLLGKQVGALEVGQTGLGRIITGTSSNNRTFYGFDFSSDPADQDAASKVIDGAKSVAAPF